MAENQFLPLAVAAAEAAGIPPQLFLGLIQTESGFTAGLVSRAGAIGLGQVMPVWARNPEYSAAIGMPGLTVEALHDPETNLTAAARILASELKRFNGSWELAAMAYNAGAGAVRKAMSVAGTSDPAIVSTKLPAAETRAYWQKVLNWSNVFANKMGAAQASIENATVETVENIKGGGFAAPLIMVFLALGGLFLMVRK